ncbi:hypothetical protein Scep_016594 [Stephania cephalantha]|uniref:Uncharacterized protein n=1 Tax=Stephania cephalantha TaxID=152367 RepID=A0AAP0IPQ7_9MAGN
MVVSVKITETSLMNLLILLLHFTTSLSDKLIFVLSHLQVNKSDKTMITFRVRANFKE